jgi:hypothetical protein
METSFQDNSSDSQSKKEEVEILLLKIGMME